MPDDTSADDSTSGPNEDFPAVYTWSDDTEALVPVTTRPEIDSWRQKLISNQDLQKMLLPYDIDRSQLAQATAPTDGTSAFTPTSLHAEASHLYPEDENPSQPSFSPSKPTEPVDFTQITSHITPALLARLTASSSANQAWSISTTSCAAQDREDIPGLEPSDRNFSPSTPAGSSVTTNRPRTEGEEAEEAETHFLLIDLKRTWREGAVGEERTRGARDRSWALRSVVSGSRDGSRGVDDGGDEEENYDDQGKEGRNKKVNGNRESREAMTKEKVWGSALLGEMEVCFLMILLLSNWSCLQQWRRIIELVLTSREAISEQKSFFASFLRLLRLQLQRCGDVEGGLFDVRGEEAGWLKNLLRGFRRTLMIMDGVRGVKAEWKALEMWTRREWGWELSDSFVRRGMVDLEDGERVELEMDDMEGEDERGEYAPVVVELE